MNNRRFVMANLANPAILNFVLNNKIIGKIVIKDNKLEFEGDVGVSAKILLDKLKPIIDNYIKEKLEMIN